MNRLVLYVLIVYSNSIFAQLKIGKSPKVVENNTYLQVESDASRHLVVTKDSSKLGIGTTAPNFSLEMIGLNNNDAIAVGNAILGSSFRGKISVLGSGANDRWMRFNSDWNSTTNNTRAFGFFRGTNEYLTILDNGNVGIGINNPLNKLVVRGLNNQPSALGTAQTNAIFRVEGESNHALDMGTFTNSPWGSYIQSHNKAAATSLPFSINPVGGNVGIGTTNPTSRLEVNGSATNTTAFNAAAGTTIDFSRSNLAYTTASAGAFTLTNIKDGGTYTLAVQGTTSGTASFTATSFTFRLINNVATIAGKQTLYTFIVMGATVYVYMASGF